MSCNVLVVIPARGGSKGIPRKNIRALGGYPLIFYSIKVALDSKYELDVYVSTDDGEVATISQKLGANVVLRDSSQAQDATTLDPVIYSAYRQAENIEKKSYEIVVTLQPTSPLLKTSSLDEAIKTLLSSKDIDTVISAKDDTHLSWRKEGGVFKPNYKERLNRQYLEPVYKETGGFLVTRSEVISDKNRIGNSVHLQLLQAGEDIDIDTFEDWNICEYYLKRRKILFVVSGYPEIGLGHVYNSLIIANDILNHQIDFLVDDKSEMAFKKISAKNYNVYKQKSDNILEDIFALNPDVVINDRLDTDKSYVCALKAANIKTINFEDLGEGGRLADLVINAIYPEKEVLPKHYFGHEYFILRDEFCLTSPKPVSKEVGNVLITFGGVDPNNYTLKVLKAIYASCRKRGVEISIVTGFGYSQFQTLEPFEDVKIFRNSHCIADHMNAADVVFTSAGRTTYEIASLCVPAIVLAQNKREMTHFFASAEFGFLNLGLGYDLSEKEIEDSFFSLLDNYQSRRYMSELMAKADLMGGRQRVLNLINSVVE